MGQNLIEVAELVKQEDRRQVRLAKLKEILKAWDDLFFILVGEDVFKKMPGVSNYSSFEKGMRQSLEESEHCHLMGTPATVHPPDDLLKQVGKLLSVDYAPPQDGKGMAVDLMGLSAYYRSNFISPSIEMVLDLSLCKLIGVVNRMYGATQARGKTILTGRKKQKEEVASSRSVISGAFYELGIKNKPRYQSKRRIAQDIRTYLLSKNQKLPVEEQKNIPSEKTIIRYMELDETIRCDLINMGVVKDKPTLVQ
jgi:hypothetical protein